MDKIVHVVENGDIQLYLPSYNGLLLTIWQFLPTSNTINKFLNIHMEQHYEGSDVNDIKICEICVQICT
jgi:hypothetical protein